MIHPLLVAYWTVLVAELIGDRSIYTIISLAIRLRPLAVYSGIAIAFMGKMLVAVLLGKALTYLPLAWTSAISAATFFAMAISIGLKRDKEDASRQPARSWQRSVTISFSAVFFSEWADFGQISAAALAARYHAPTLVWLGGSLALCTKGVLAMTLGLSLRQRVPGRLARALSIVSCSCLGFVSLYDVVVH